MSGNGSTMDCSECFFAKVTNMAAAKIEYDCRRNPPAVNLMMTQRGGVVEPVKLSSWPTVLKGQWCGEFKPKLLPRQETKDAPSSKVDLEAAREGVDRLVPRQGE